MDTSNEWIIERTGIHERRFVTQPCGNAELALPACEQAIADAGIEKTDIELIIVATTTPEHQFPGTSSFLQANLDLQGVPTLDIRVQCSGFIYGLSIADQFIKTGQYQYILLVGVEVQSVGLNLTTEGRDTAILFGDGAGAAIISRSDNDSEILSTHLFGDGKHAMDLSIDAPVGYECPRISKEMIDEGRQFPKMNGRQVFKHAITRFPEVVREALKANNWSIEDVDMVVPHQANMRITEAITKRLGLLPEKVFSNIHKYGNTTAASIPLALADACEEQKIRRGDKVVLAAFGSGFTWASAAIIW